MSAGTELETVEEPTAEVAMPVITPEQAQQMVRQLRELISRILVKDKHYMTLRNKDVLLKAGAEELGKFFALSSQYSDLITERTQAEDKDGSLVNIWAASVKCSVSNKHGRILAESYGFYDGSERRKSGGMIDRGQPANTIVKMAQKRAFVGAILTATGTSELFTQDIEDTEATGPPAPAAIDDRMASDDEQRVLLELFIRKGGRTATEAKEWLDGYGPRGASANWCARQVLNLVQRPDVAEVPEADPAAAAAAVKPTDPELPVEVVDAEDVTVDDEEVPF